MLFGLRYHFFRMFNTMADYFELAVHNIMSDVKFSAMLFMLWKLKRHALNACLLNV